MKIKNITFMGIAIVAVALFVSFFWIVQAKEEEIKIGEPIYSKLEQQRQRVDFFEEVMGVTEAEFKKLSEKDKQRFLLKDLGKLENEKTDKSFFHGTFSTISIGELRKQSEQKPKQGGGVFNVIEGYDKPWEHWFREHVDVGALQARQENRDTVFQVASNFNALEGGGSPHAGMMNYLDPSMFVQGEAAAISAAPGLIYRMYYVPHKVNGVMYYGQLQKQINFLSELSEYVVVQNGYVQNITKKGKDSYIFPSTRALTRSGYAIDEVQIGFHEGIQVPFGLTKLKHEHPKQDRFSRWALVDDEHQLINQVFTSTLMLNDAWLKDICYANLARMLLYAAYEGTLKAAFVKGKKKVFLTLVGGGVFQNKLSWIQEALKFALDSFTARSGLNVTLIIYWSGAYDKSEFAEFKTELIKLVEKTGGTYTRYKKDGVYQVKSK